MNLILLLFFLICIVSLNLNQSMERFKYDLNENLYYYMAQCFNRGLSKEDIKSYIDKVFLDFNKK